jgi:GR25 family glycosyltransferase involved in LPS biosynthesis
MTKSVFNSIFDRVVVINLDRRPDRLSSVSHQLDMLNITYHRHTACDGQTPQVAADWAAYQRETKVASDGVRSVSDWRDFYLGDKPHHERVAFFEKERGPALASAGAWALFQSMREVVKSAVADNVESLLILEDDVRFHRDTISLWPKIASELPVDWQVFQLGAMQLHWEEDWINWHSQHLYQCNGSSIAAHAVALKRDAMRAVLARSQTPDLPFDVGPLQEVKRLYRDRCFTAYPNLAIQDPSDTEIGMSKIFFQEAQKDDNIYRWKWKDYGPDVLRPVLNDAVKPKANQKAEPPQVSPLQPYSAGVNTAERVIVVFGPKDAQESAAFIALLKSQKDQGEIAPIVLLDGFDHIPQLRDAGLAFEYVPPEHVYEDALPFDRSAALIVARRLSIIRRKWAPTRIIALGQNAQPRLAAWRASVFETNVMGPDLASDADLLGRNA